MIEQSPRGGDDPDGTEGNESCSDEPGSEHETPHIDVSAALHMAGHEVEDLGLESVPDVAAVIHSAEEHERARHDADEVWDEIAAGSEVD